MAQFKQTTRH